jgi:hypothetical protein
MARGYRRGDAPSVVFSGMVAGTPHHGGATWAMLNYVLGFVALGCEVTFVEPVDHATCPEVVDYAAATFAAVGLDGRWCLVDAAGGTAGMDRQQLRRAAADADVLVNVSGMLTDSDVLDRIDRRVYLDLDPGFVQMWHAAGVDMRLDAHTHFVSLSDSIGAFGSPIPSCGRTWIATLPPVVLDLWQPCDTITHEAFTTIANWRSYGTVEHEGRAYGQKAHFVRSIVSLPRRAPERFVLALAIDPGETADVDALRTNGWDTVDPSEVAATPGDYRRFVRGSRAEIGIAKSGYVASGSGWFSDRSACYLAAGRPVVAAATGFDRRLPLGAGLFAFADVDGFLAAADEIRRDPGGHRAAAHQIARDHLDATTVVGQLLEQVA